MKDAGKEEKKDEEPIKESKDPIEKLNQNLRSIHTVVATGDSRVMGRVVRSLSTFRRTIKTEVLMALLDEFVDKTRPAKELFLSSVQVDHPMTEGGVAEIKFAQFAKPYPPEFEAFAVLILLVRLLDLKETDKSIECANIFVSWLKGMNRRTLDVFTARAYFYLSLAYERGGRLAAIRSELLAAYRTSCLRHDMMGQATLLNLLLRNYITHNLYDQALKLVLKTTFPESRPNAQYARYLFYIGQIKAVQLEYSDSHSKLMQAIRKAPQGASIALGFKLAAYKLAIIVELLMGGIPDRSTFMQKELREPLQPYCAITQAVRSGDLEAFKASVKQHEALFKKDKTFTLITRLRYNVIKTGLRAINLSYSRISLKAICAKLGLESEQDAAGVVAKAVVDGVIDATIDYDNMCLQSQQRLNLYSSCEPQKALHKRITFCLQMHNDTVKGMAYPRQQDGKMEDSDMRRERQQELVSVDDDDDDDMLL